MFKSRVSQTEMRYSDRTFWNETVNEDAKTTSAGAGRGALGHEVGQAAAALGTPGGLSFDLTLLVIDLFAFFVAQEQYHCSEKKDGSPPSYSICPAEFPNRSVSWNRKNSYNCIQLLNEEISFWINLWFY